MLFTDAAPITGLRMTRDGYAVAEVRAARIGIQTYRGDEVGRPDLASVAVYRPPESVFAADSLASYGFKPATINHPPEGVTADSWKKLAVGIVGGDVARDGDFVRVPLALMDAEAISAVESGLREISMGYVCDLAFEEGVTPEGEPYQAVQRDIRINHLALVPKGRAGPHCRIGDKGFSDEDFDEPKPTGDHDVALKTITVDGLPVEITDAGEMAINLLRGKLADAATALQTAKATHDAALAAKDAELAKKDAEIADLKTKVVDGAALDTLVADRSAIVGKAKALLPTLDVAGKTNAEIKRAALGDDAKDKSEAYVDALFDIKTADLKPADPLRSAIADSTVTTDADTAVADARAEMLRDLRGEKAAA
jgi:hypothetical protein